MKENSYIKAVTRHLPKEFYRWKINDDYEGGVPDFFLEGLEKDIWVEFKFIKQFPKRENTLIDLTKEKYLSKLQQIWLERRHKNRRDAIVVVGCEFGGHIFCGLEWQTPIPAGVMKKTCLSHKQIASELLKMANGGAVA